MHGRSPAPLTDVDACVDALRAALADHGITLPSLRTDLPTFAGRYEPPAGLVSLGNCNTATARRLTAVLRGHDDKPDPDDLDPANDPAHAPAQDLDLAVVAVPDAVPDLRRAVRAHLGAPCPDVQLCVTELVANVIRHVGEGTPVRVRVARVDGGGRIRVEVDDPDARALPVLLHASSEDESGRGLELLNAVATRWGVQPGEAGKTVWCEVPEELQRTGSVKVMGS